jgi:hypothetical protein
MTGTGSARQGKSEAIARIRPRESQAPARKCNTVIDPCPTQAKPADFKIEEVRLASPGPRACPEKVARLFRSMFQFFEFERFFSITQFLDRETP